MSLRTKYLVLIFILLLFIYASFSFANIFQKAISWVIRFLVAVLKSILEFFSGLVASAIDAMRNLQLFGEKAPADIIWKVFLNLAYPFLVFATLYIAFQYILGKSDTAHRMLWQIVLVAILINFTFAFLKEAYGIVLKLENSLIGTSVKVTVDGKQQPIGLGRGLKELFFTGMPSITDLSHTYEGKLIKNEEEDTSVFGEIAAQISLAFFYIIAFVILVMIAVLMMGRIIYISAMTGLAPLALVSLALPIKTSFGFSQWLQTTFQWLSVILIFVFLVIIGMSLQINVIQSVFRTDYTDTLQNFINYLIGFLFIAAWYVLSIKWAVQNGGAFGSWGEKVGFGALGFLGAGALALGSKLGFQMQRRAKFGIGRGLSSIGTRLKTRGGTIGRMGLNLEKRGSTLQKDYLENVVKKDLEVAQQNVETGKNPEALSQWIQKHASSPSLDVQRLVAGEISKLEGGDLEKFLQIDKPEVVGERLKYLQTLRAKNRIVYNALVNRMGSLSHKQSIKMLNHIDKANRLDDLNKQLPEVVGKINSSLPILNARFPPPDAQSRDDIINFLTESFEKVAPSVDPGDFTNLHSRDQDYQIEAFVNMATKNPKKAIDFVANQKWAPYLANLFAGARDEFDRLPQEVKDVFQSQNISPPKPQSQIIIARR